MIIPLFVGLLYAIYLVFSAYDTRRYHRQLNQIPHRIHVNGIRGKSSVTRLIAASLREGGLQTAAKTTGTAARVIIDHDTDIPVPRKEADIAEQRRMISAYLGSKHSMYTSRPYQAIVFECMAINPLYQRYLERKIMRSTIGVITNVREDHMDLLGHTLADIARSLASTIPINGHLVTAETDPAILAILREECEKRGSKLHPVGTHRVSSRQMAKFAHFEYASNVAIAIKVAELIGINRQTALSGMHKANPDPGAFVLQELAVPNRTLFWANLFAINDRESFIYTANVLHEKVGPKTKKAVILNNRLDRPERVLQFVNICLDDIKADYIITFGDYEPQIKKELARHTKHRAKVLYLGNSTAYKNADGETLLRAITKKIRAKRCVLYGTVNIHTKQAEALLHVLEPAV
ncbi:poly-gamma-glutamate synthase PgsB [Candidatus Saccharibacteria bacterium]|nr:MAG: poly-gamma-glutamate synthase PgsB [Candidatus Saccharibacteria bacterium]